MGTCVLPRILFSNSLISRHFTYFQVPAFTPEQEKIPYARVNHNKYIVTEKSGIVGNFTQFMTTFVNKKRNINNIFSGTSNWSADYFVSTGGIGFVLKANGTSMLHQDLKNIFQRDWASSYAHPV